MDHSKFEHFCKLVASIKDILLIAETKLDSSVTISKFLIPSFQKPFRMDLDRKRGEILVYVKSSLLLELLLNFKLPDDIQVIPFEVVLRTKWPFVSNYKPPSGSSQRFLGILSDLLDFYSREHASKVVYGDVNLEPTNSITLNFLSSQNFINLMKKKYSSQNISPYETGPSDHHHLINSVMKTAFSSEEAKKLTYKDYSKFSPKAFEDNLMLDSYHSKHDYLEFEKHFVNTLHKHAPKKTKITQGNYYLYVNKILCKVMIKRPQL